jgi:hypothetical protein
MGVMTILSQLSVRGIEVRFLARKKVYYLPKISNRPRVPMGPVFCVLGSKAAEA